MYIHLLFTDIKSGSHQHGKRCGDIIFKIFVHTCIFEYTLLKKNIYIKKIVRHMVVIYRGTQFNMFEPIVRY